MQCGAIELSLSFSGPHTTPSTSAPALLRASRPLARAGWSLTGASAVPCTQQTLNVGPYLTFSFETGTINTHPSCLAASSNLEVWPAKVSKATGNSISKYIYMCIPWFFPESAPLYLETFGLSVDCQWFSTILYLFLNSLLYFRLLATWFVYNVDCG